MTRPRLRRLDSGESHALGRSCAWIWRIQLRLGDRCRAEGRPVPADPAGELVAALVPRDVAPLAGCYTQGMAQGMAETIDSI